LFPIYLIACTNNVMVISFPMSALQIYEAEKGAF
jgi:hypothetical protein